jgi:hypothetical protein
LPPLYHTSAEIAKDFGKIISGQGKIGGGWPQYSHTENIHFSKIMQINIHGNPERLHKLADCLILYSK